MSTQQTLLTKSIIYGPIQPTCYGMIRSLCSAISSKSHIDKIILYLRSNHNFLKYNKFIYGFRLEQGEEVFITEAEGKKRFLEGYNDQQGFQIGEKVLELLKKFNVRNVLVIVAIRQRDPLRDVFAQDFVQIVKCAKELLSSLYDKVVNSKLQETLPTEQKDQKQPIQVKQFKMPLQQFNRIQKPLINPNYVGKQFVKKLKEQSLQSKHKAEMQFLNGKIKQLATVLQQIIQQFGQSQDAQVKFAIKYDQSKRVQKVLLMLSLLFQFPSPTQFLSHPISSYLKSITSRNLTSNTIRKLNQQLMSDRQLRSEVIVRENQICGVLMEFVEVLLKSYGFARRLAGLEAEVEGTNEDTKGKIETKGTIGDKKTINKHNLIKGSNITSTKGI